MQTEATCLSCGHELRRNAHFCPCCGAAVRPSAATPVPEPGDEGRSCPHCGMRTNRDARFCRSCGQSLDTAIGDGIRSTRTIKNTFEKSGKTLRILAIVSSVILLLIGIATLRYATTSSDDGAADGKVALHLRPLASMAIPSGQSRPQIVGQCPGRCFFRKRNINDLYGESEVAAILRGIFTRRGV